MGGDMKRLLKLLHRIVWVIWMDFDRPKWSKKMLIWVNKKRRIE